ncbi:hypothetical protein [Enhygromyxa salina]|uniref:Glycosyltransferase RgtA/B/C/D-like domain-containing protein n=1 Tax=Enhygromyxa salina TaxID=215803 RepID=A0A2S9YYP9_9BACT|nr:hypothetical protein [Enhygromyxa salina]PRQ10221.1 hypothetical protein ENSA7_00290 [Enhygromyxa salina]
MAAILRSVLSLLVLLIALWPARAGASPGFSETCEQALSKDQVDELLDRMRPIAAAGPCSLGRVDTSLFRTEIEWISEAGPHTALLGPRGCVREPTHEGADLAYYAPPELGERCPAAVELLRAFVGDVREQLAPVMPDQVAEISDVTDGEADESLAGVDVADPLVVASVAWLAALGLGLVAAGQRWRELAGDEAARSHARRWGIAMVAVFVLALVARFWVVASVGNWYGSFLPPAGVGELRFGASAAVLQASVRALSPWTVNVAFALARVVGALAVPLVVLLVRRLGGSLSAGVVAGVLLALAPIAVRLSASSSEHVLAGTLALAAWVVWLRAAADPRVVPRILSLVLVVLAVLTRVDCWPQLSLIVVWSVVSPVFGQDRVTWLAPARRFADALYFGVCWAALGAYAWVRLVVPSNHPGPELDGIRDAAKLLVSQFWVATITPPHWISPLCLGLAVVGIGLAAWARRWRLLLGAVLSLALIFIPIGRNLTHDGLTGARYFVLALPILVLLAAQVGEAASDYLQGPRAGQRRAWLGAGALALVVVESVAARPGWRHVYTFQAEYVFLAKQLQGRDLDGCTLWFVRPRQATDEPDLDCCLAPDRSPLRLLAPDLRFRSMPNDAEPDDAHGCHLYYEGSLCEIDPSLAPRAPETVARILDQCDRLRRRAGVLVLGREQITSDSLGQRWQGPPVIELIGRFE